MSLDASTSLYAKTLDTFKDVASIRDDEAIFSKLLDEQKGIAAEYERICQDRVHAASNLINTDEYVSEEEIEMSRLEGDTWALIRALYPERLSESFVGTSSAQLLQRNPYTPTSALAGRIVQASRQLTELQVIEGWLQSTAPAPSHIETRSEYRLYTKSRIQQELRQGSKKKVTSGDWIDPDAANRGSGSRIDPQDAAYEKELSYAILSFLRSGRLSDAIDLCIECHQPWLAAIMSGAKTFSYMAITSREPQPAADSEAMQEDGDNARWSGCRRRKLWRDTCIRATAPAELPFNTLGLRKPGLPAPTRAVIAALAPSPQSMPALVSLMRTWEDHLWARVEMLLHDRISNSLDALGGFWEKGLKAEKRSDEDGMQTDGLAGEDEWCGEVHKVLHELTTVKVEGRDFDDPFHFAQWHIITGRAGEMMERVAQSITSGTFNQENNPRRYVPTIRFYTHLCLVLRFLRVDMPLKAQDEILAAYSSILEAEGDTALVLMYAGAFGDKSVERYAAYLAHLEGPKSTRLKALQECPMNGIDIAEVVLKTSAIIRDEVISKRFPGPEGPLPPIIVGQVDLTSDERRLCLSVEWLTYNRGTFSELLAQANAVMRLFLYNGRILAAQHLCQLLAEDEQFLRPQVDDVYHTPDPAEYLHYKAFFRLWATLESLSTLEDYPQHGSAASKSHWKSELSSRIDATYTLGKDFLKRNWLDASGADTIFGKHAFPYMFTKGQSLTDTGDGSADDTHLMELDRIRKIYVPEVVIQLNTMLYAHCDFLPWNLNRAMDLVPIVADGRYNVYSTFSSSEGNRLKDYLKGVRGVSIALLGQGRGPVDLFEGSNAPRH
ncbi:Nucleoporin nup84 [Tulasnella sp. 331]|nr:Nucleoporin nup84 [Tulasnella sp. 331]